MSRTPVHLGHDRKTPLILGDVNNAPARLVEGTGLFLAVRKGDRRWVTGSLVDRGLRQGVLIAVATGDEPPMTAAQLRQAVDAELTEPPAPTRPPVPADADLAALRAPSSAPRPVQAPKAAPVKRAAPKAVNKSITVPAKKAVPHKRVVKK